MWLFWMWACTTPLETSGPDGFVGRVVDATGAPLAGLRVTSVEEEDDTDAEGRFAVRWKAPEQHLRFRWGPLAVERRYAPADDGRVLELVLPTTREAVLVCPPTACALTATWDLGQGFQGTLRTRCEPGAETPLADLPVGRPELACRAGHGTDALPVGEAFDEGGRLGLR